MSAEERTRSKGRRTAEEFIADAHRLYGDKYDYGQVKYVNSYTKATIICRKLGHGAWQQTPKDHLHGYGCPQCYADRRGDTTRGTAEGFIARAQAKHGDKYDYGRVEYRNSDTKVTIICREHGEFEQSPYSHLQGQGCPICGDKRSADAGRWTKEQFLRRAKEVHGHKYDYSQVEYKSALTKVTIICPRHGPWEQTPANHLFGLGTGCPACSESEGARTVRLVLESLGSRFKSEYRIPECRDKRALPFDFAVWVAGILHLIEFHGRQHYESGGIWIKRKGHTIAEKEFREIQKRDAVKSDFCANHSIPLLVIPYWEMKNVEILAREFLTALPC